MTQEQNTQAGAFKTIQIIYSALVFGVLFFTIIAYIVTENPVFKIDLEDLFTIVVPIATIAGIFLSNLLYTKILNRGNLSKTLSSKLTKYQTAMLVRAACLEGPAFLAIAATFLSDNASFLLVSLLMATLMYLKFPSKEKFASELTLNSKEKSELQKL